MQVILQDQFGRLKWGRNSSVLIFGIQLWHSLRLDCRSEEILWVPGGGVACARVDKLLSFCKLGVLGTKTINGHSMNIKLNNVLIN